MSVIDSKGRDRLDRIIRFWGDYLVLSKPIDRNTLGKQEITRTKVRKRLK